MPLLRLWLKARDRALHQKMSRLWRRGHSPAIRFYICLLFWRLNFLINQGGPCIYPFAGSTRGVGSSWSAQHGRSSIEILDSCTFPFAAVGPSDLCPQLLGAVGHPHSNGLLGGWKRATDLRRENHPPLLGPCAGSAYPPRFLSCLH